MVLVSGVRGLQLCTTLIRLAKWFGLVLRQDLTMLPGWPGTSYEDQTKRTDSNTSLGLSLQVRLKSWPSEQRQEKCLKMHPSQASLERGRVSLVNVFKHLPSPSLQVTPALVFAVSVAAIGSFQFGYNTGVINAPETVSVVSGEGRY